MFRDFKAEIIEERKNICIDVQKFEDKKYKKVKKKTLLTSRDFKVETMEDHKKIYY